MYGEAFIKVQVTAHIPEGEEDPNLWFDNYIREWATNHNISLEKDVVDIEAYVGEDIEDATVDNSSSV